MSSTIQLSKRANWAGYEIAPSPRDGRELRSGKEKHEAVDFGKGSLPKRDNPVPQVTVGQKKHKCYFYNAWSHKNKHL